MALDDYFTDPSQDCLARLFDAVNAMDIASAPTLTRYEKLIMRSSERKDVFGEKFAERRVTPDNAVRHTLITHSNESRSSFEGKTRSRTESLTSQHSVSEASFSLGGSAVWVGDESGLDNGHNQVPPPRGRRSTDASSASSHGVSGRREESAAAASYTNAQLQSMVKDTHFFPTSIAYKGHTLPIRMPLSTFPEEVGDVRVRFIQKRDSKTDVVYSTLSFN